MSADSSRKPVKQGTSGQVILPQTVSDPSIIESVAGFIHEVVPQAYSSVLPGDARESIIWARFETCDFNDPERFIITTECESEAIPPLLLVLGYGTGVQVWSISGSGEAAEVLSWSQGQVRTLRLLQSPRGPQADPLAKKRPLAAIVDSAGPGPQFCTLNFISLKTGVVVKSIKFKTPVCDVFCNKKSVVVTFAERIAIFDVATLEDRMTITTCYLSPGMNQNPVALGPRWLAYAEKRLTTWQRSSGGCEGEGAQSYTATVIHAAKSLGKGLRDLSGSLTGNVPQPTIPSTAQPGIVTIVDIETKSTKEDCPDNLIAHFVGHVGPIVAMTFDPSGLLLVTADKHGHRFHVFRVHPHPCGPALAAVHHLYILHRGDTTARVQDIAISWDSRWVAVSSVRGTTHVFPITPYGGPVAVRTHTTPHVVNRLSRFERSAGLSDGRGSPVGESAPWPGNPRLPPYPHPTPLSPLAQLRRGAPHLPPAPPEEPSVRLAASFAQPRAWLPGRPRAKRQLVESLFVMASHGNLIQYDLDPKCIAGVPKDKISYDTGIELGVEAKAEWVLLRPPYSSAIQPPLSPLNPLICSFRPLTSGTRFNEDRWLSQVEIITHTGPHRRLWMGPQFSFKTIDPVPSGNILESNEQENESVPARSNPVNMPHRPYLLIESGSGGSVDSPHLADYGDDGDESVHRESRLREDLADAMLDAGTHASGAAGGGRLRAALLERQVNPMGTVVTLKTPPGTPKRPTARLPGLLNQPSVQNVDFAANIKPKGDLEKEGPKYFTKPFNTSSVTSKCTPEVDSEGIMTNIQFEKTEVAGIEHAKSARKKGKKGFDCQSVRGEVEKSNKGDVIKKSFSFLDVAEGSSKKSSEVCEGSSDHNETNLNQIKIKGKNKKKVGDKIDLNKEASNDKKIKQDSEDSSDNGEKDKNSVKSEQYVDCTEDSALPDHHEKTESTNLDTAKGLASKEQMDFSEISTASNFGVTCGSINSQDNNSTEKAEPVKKKKRSKKSDASTRFYDKLECTEKSDTSSENCRNIKAENIDKEEVLLPLKKKGGNKKKTTVEVNKQKLELSINLAACNVSETITQSMLPSNNLENIYQKEMSDELMETNENIKETVVLLEEDALAGNTIEKEAQIETDKGKIMEGLENESTKMEEQTIDHKPQVLKKSSKIYDMGNEKEEWGAKAVNKIPSDCFQGELLIDVEAETSVILPKKQMELSERINAEDEKVKTVSDETKYARSVLNFKVDVDEINNSENLSGSGNYVTELKTEWTVAEEVEINPLIPIKNQERELSSEIEMKNLEMKLTIKEFSDCKTNGKRGKQGNSKFLQANSSEDKEHYLGKRLLYSDCLEQNSSVDFKKSSNISEISDICEVKKMKRNKSNKLSLDILGKSEEEKATSYLESVSGDNNSSEMETMTGLEFSLLALNDEATKTGETIQQEIKEEIEICFSREETETEKENVKEEKQISLDETEPIRKNNRANKKKNKTEKFGIQRNSISCKFRDNVDKEENKAGADTPTYKNLEGTNADPKCLEDEITYKRNIDKFTEKGNFNIRNLEGMKYEEEQNIDFLDEDTKTISEDKIEIMNEEEFPCLLEKKDDKPLDTSSTLEQGEVKKVRRDRIKKTKGLDSLELKGKDVMEKSKSVSPVKSEPKLDTDSSDEANLKNTDPRLLIQRLPKRKKLGKKIDDEPPQGKLNNTPAIKISKLKQKSKSDIVVFEPEKSDYDTCSEKKSDSSVESFPQFDKKLEDPNGNIPEFRSWSNVVKQPKEKEPICTTNSSEDKDSVYESCNEEISAQDQNIAETLAFESSKEDFEDQNQEVEKNASSSSNSEEKKIDEKETSLGQQLSKKSRKQKRKKR